MNVSYHHAGQWHDLLVKPKQSYNPMTTERRQSFRLTNLVAESVYECLVQSKNQHGFGDLSDVHQWYTLPEGGNIENRGCRSYEYVYLIIFMNAFILLRIFY